MQGKKGWFVAGMPHPLRPHLHSIPVVFFMIKMTKHAKMKINERNIDMNDIIANFDWIKYRICGIFTGSRGLGSTPNKRGRCIKY